MRRVVFHYHLFKNAGTSVDKILQGSFPEKWAEREFRFTKDHWPYEEIGDWIDNDPETIAFSSHTARLPVPVLENTEIFPVVFVRHPLLRLYSGYRYELTQDADTPGAKMARQTDFSGYLAWRLERPRDASARNFQSNRLSHMYRPERGMLTQPKDLETLAMKSLETLPFIGFVEKFDLSMTILSKSLSRKGLELKLTRAEENVNSDLTLPTDDKVKAIHGELGEEIYEKFLQQNAVDLRIYETVKSWYG